MFRDAIGHRERDASKDPKQKARYDDRQQAIEQTTFGEAHATLQRIADDLAAVLVAQRIAVPGLDLFGSHPRSPSR
jgi:hypothetical protein